jgi:hypothetical protein
MSWAAFFVAWSAFAQYSTAITPTRYPDGRYIPWNAVYCDLKERNALFQFYVGYCHLRRGRENG